MKDRTVITEIMPQFERQAGGKVAAQPSDKDLVKTVPVIEVARGVFEGLAGLETTILCTLEECPYHHFRICGRVSLIPDDAASCRQREVLSQEYGWTPEAMAKLVPELSRPQPLPGNGSVRNIRHTWATNCIDQYQTKPHGKTLR